MSFFGKWNAVVLSAALAVVVSGCSQVDSGPMDEEKEPHYMLGKSRVKAMDYDGAIRAFEESLEANPHSAQAHYQLAILYENQESDPAAAIYHYQQYLKFDPQSGNAEIITQHISNCKQQLAADVLQLPSAPAAQQQLEKLTEENRRLHDQLAQWQAYYAAQQAAAKTNPVAPQTSSYYTSATPVAQQTSLTPDDVTSQPVTPLTASSNTSNYAPPARRTTAAFKPASTRTHTVARGETMASISRKLGISLTALEAANPTVNPKKLKAGQIINLPPS